MNPSRPLVSVVVPSYNHEKFLEQCLTSILNQTYAPIELIVIDDGSTDRSLEVLADLRKKFSFEFRTQANQGVARALNFGISLCHGEYIAFCASDDYWSPEKIEEQIKMFQQNLSLGLVYAKAREFDERGLSDKTLGKYFAKTSIFDELLSENFIPAVTVMIPKKVLDKVGLFDPQFYIEDYLLWLKIAKICPVASVDSVLAFYRKNPVSLSANLEKMSASERAILKIFEDEDAYSRVITKWRLYWLGVSLSTAPLSRSWKVLHGDFTWKMLFYRKFWVSVLRFSFQIVGISRNRSKSS